MISTTIKGRTRLFVVSFWNRWHYTKGFICSVNTTWKGLFVVCAFPTTQKGLFIVSKHRIFLLNNSNYNQGIIHSFYFFDTTTKGLFIVGVYIYTTGKGLIEAEVLYHY